MTNPVISGGNGHYAVSGELGFKTVSHLLEQSLDTLFDDAPAQLDMDLASVTRVDSAGLALLLQWMRLARQHDTSILFHNLPPQLLAIARTGELDTLLPLAD